jgi:dUTP pyrophosphatase
MNPSSKTVCVQFKRLRAAAVLPRYQSDEAAGLDLAACPAEGDSIAIEPGEIRAVPTGWAVAIPAGFEGQVRPRSGLATRHGVTIPNSPGTIDSDYRGEVIVALINLGRARFVIEPGMRIAQLIIGPVVRASIIEAIELEPTERGAGGFGSTGL